MLIEGSNGPAVSLRPVRWQFPPDVGAWDDQWLVVGGTVDLGDRTWSFEDPCLLIGEARELVTWLRRVAAGEGGESSLSFMEPVLGFSVAGRAGDELVVRVRVAAEGVPPRRRDDSRTADHAVELRLRAGQLLVAAGAWERELDALPDRSFASTR